ncbi:uncharacterized protein [Spinacia oleracea]|uniref:Retrotransposon gag domain-containing protein n=1 Tax=Spinacia oleracea TaxID=3562 RepID=A0ABM3RJC9_SPIOL|nr:uncharacterized protein LOC130470143 [Spinacia oleracea]
MSQNLKDKNLEELENLFDHEENPNELNNIMKIIAEKWVDSDSEDNENNYVSIEEELNQQMGLIKLEVLEAIPLEIIQQNVENKLEKMVVENNNVVGEEILQEKTMGKNCVNNFIQRPRYQGESSCTQPKYVSGRKTRFNAKVMPNKFPKKEEIKLEPISQTGYKLSLDGLRNREDVIEHWKKSMSSVLNLNTEWTLEIFLNYIEHNLYGRVADWYDGLDEEVKGLLRESEVPTTTFRQLCQYIEAEFIGSKADLGEKMMECQRNLSNLSVCNIKYIESYIMEFEQYYYKIGENKTNLGMFYDKLPNPINEEINEKYQELVDKHGHRDALGRMIEFLRKWIEKKCREVVGTQQMKRQFITCWDMPNDYGCTRKKIPFKRHIIKK